MTLTNHLINRNALTFKYLFFGMTKYFHLFTFFTLFLILSLIFSFIAFSIISVVSFLSESSFLYYNFRLVLPTLLADYIFFCKQFILILLCRQYNFPSNISISSISMLDILSNVCISIVFYIYFYSFFFIVQSSIFSFNFLPFLPFFCIC